METGESSDIINSTGQKTALRLVLSSSPLSLDAGIDFVSHASAGAIATFIGTTRDHHDGRPVLELSYEAHAPLALRELRAVCGVASTAAEGRHSRLCGTPPGPRAREGGVRHHRGVVGPPGARPGGLRRHHRRPQRQGAHLEAGELHGRRAGGVAGEQGVAPTAPGIARVAWTAAVCENSCACRGFEVCSFPQTPHTDLTFGTTIIQSIACLTLTIFIFKAAAHVGRPASNT